MRLGLRIPHNVKMIYEIPPVVILTHHTGRTLESRRGARKSLSTKQAMNAVKAVVPDGIQSQPYASLASSSV